MAPSEKVRVHVSFPQLKYPSMRDNGLKDPIQWLEGKQMDDAVGPLWRVHDKLYDLSEFIKFHPGGQDWIHLTRGTDVTEAFETHHIGEKASKMLTKFFIKDATSPRNSPFTFKEDDFYLTLKRRVREELKMINVDDHEKKSRLIMDSLLVAVLSLSIVSCKLDSFNLLLPVLVLAGLSVAWTAICSHNYFHKADNWRMYLFNVTFISYREWRVSHALSHHLFPNTLFDLEISGFEPLFNWIPTGNSYRFIAYFIWPFLYMMAFWIQGFRTIFLWITKKDYFKNFFYWDNLLAVALPIFMFLVSGAPLGLVMIRWMQIITASSFIFAFIGFNAAHHHPDIFHEGDVPIARQLDWGIHQLDAVMDRVEITGSLFRVLTNFGDHGLHHMFPTLDHAVLPLLYPVFFEVCDKFQTELRMTSQLDMVIGQFKQLYRTEIKDRSKK